MIELASENTTLGIWTFPSNSRALVRYQDRGLMPLFGSPFVLMCLPKAA